MSRSLLRNRAGAAPLLLLAAVSLVPGLASAQDIGLHTVVPGTARKADFYSVPSIAPRGAWQWDGGLTLSFADEPLAERNPDGDTVATLVDNLLVADLTGSLSIAESLHLGIGLPFVLAQGGEAPVALGGRPAIEGGAGIGDLRVDVAWTAWSQHNDESATGFSAGPLLRLSLPTGDGDRLQSGGLQTTLGGAAEFRADSGLRAGAHLGWVLRDEASFANLAVDDALRWGLAAELPLVARVRLLAELVGEIPVLADGATSEETPTELLLGGRWDLGDLALHAVVGTGLVKGFGTPSFRGAIGAAWGQIPNPDLDDDGILNKVDRCPTDPEDLDGFEDDDGCPDLDNDDDGILDDDDACENRPEDVDGFRDSDGCPDPDNDDDGIPDEADACPDDPEDVDGFDDSDGCPDPDNDGDGVPDIEDLCPDAAEDLDGFEDTNGCPDFDNDADGIPDTEDACPDQAETINGVEDFDGCPDEAPIALRFAESRIVVTGTLDFVPRGTAPTPESDPVIEAIARAMRTWPDIRLVIVVTSTEKKDRARDLRFAEDRANALRDVLVARGIDAWRITARGTGWGDVAEGVTPDPAPSVTTLELQR